MATAAWPTELGCARRDLTRSLPTPWPETAGSWLTWSMTVNVASLMSGLSEQRRAFHSEADFQLAFAWQIQRQHGGAQVRLETRPTPGQHLDVLARQGNAELAIEHKYLTSAWDGLDNGEPFHLLNHGAQDIRGYDCVKDLVLAGRYSCEWRPYSNLGGRRGEFRYLALEVTSDAIATNIESS